MGGEPIPAAILATLPARATLPNGWQLAADELLSVTQVAEGACQLVCLGTLLNPLQPMLTDEQIAKSLVQSKSFDELERATADLGGRWLLVARIGDHSRIYGDAGGLRSAFVLRDPECRWLASQPGLLATVAHLEVPGWTFERLAQSGHGDVFPPGIVPYRNVQQLLPNHYLDLASSELRRYWPTAQVPRRDLDDAASEIARLLTGSITALHQRGKRIALPLTGGYDSRTLFAASGELRKDMTFFTLFDTASVWHDIGIPRRLAARAGSRCKLVWAGSTDPNAVELVKANTGRIWRDPHEHRLPAFGKVDADLILLGNMSEIARGGFIEGSHYPELSLEALVEALGWAGDAEARSATRTWLAQAPSDLGIHPMDLLYWESRVGSWSSLCCTAIDTFIEVASPYNCRRLLLAGLGVDVRYRMMSEERAEESCLLHRRICASADPSTLREPFNTSWLKQIQPGLKRIIPPRVRRAIKQLRRAAAGAPLRN